MKTIIKIILLFSLLAPTNFANLILIVHKDFPINSISKNDLKRIYSNKMKIWSHGGSVVRVLLKRGRIHKKFCKLIKNSPSNLRRFWKKQIFTGRGLAPKSFISQKDIVEFVSSNRSAIAYVDSSTDIDSVKAIELK
ncbi:MAG: hypothetical protein COB02_01665 [Candidatus Cloacimonadota bacterium]|nr:MAG: hypothetical protein COB02_01665 [Candidatus Cloacimonadota bacterium]